MTSIYEKRRKKSRNDFSFYKSFLSGYFRMFMGGTLNKQTFATVTARTRVTKGAGSETNLFRVLELFKKPCPVLEDQ